jgi:hypothetical protein
MIESACVYSPHLNRSWHRHLLRGLLALILIVLPSFHTFT